MDTSLYNPQMIAIAGLVLLLLVALVVRYVIHRNNPPVSRNRFGDDHAQAITEMGNRTRLAAQREERERLAETTPNLGR